MPTVRLAEHLEQDYVVCDLPAVDKRTVLEALARTVSAREAGIDSEELLALLLEREAIQTTGIGDGIALPHALVPGLKRTLLILGHLRSGLEYAALDGSPVDLVFVLLSPPDAQKTHLRVLARLARLIAQTDLLARLRKASGSDVAYRILLEEDARHVY